MLLTSFDRIWQAHRYALLVLLTGSIFLPLYHPRTVLTPHDRSQEEMEKRKCGGCGKLLALCSCIRPFGRRA